jgi:hypothetical protein
MTLHRVSIRRVTRRLRETGQLPLLFLILALPLRASAAPANALPLADAAAVWHTADGHDIAGADGVDLGKRLSWTTAQEQGRTRLQ